MQPSTFRIITLIFLLSLALSACGGDSASSGGAVQAVESYLQALVDQDVDQVVNSSCAEWEASALTEVDSLTAVTTSLADLACQEAGQQKGDTLVTCSGKIIFDYDGEIQELDLVGRTYAAREEGGEWRMCGYR
jgi:hypothetical protein